MVSRLFSSAAFCLALCAPSQQAWAQESEPDERTVDFDWVPGPAQAIPHGLSASRDVGLVAFRLSPYVAATSGGDLALFSIKTEGWTFRLGLFGMMELESSEPFDPPQEGFGGMFAPGAIILWRGAYGGSFSLTLDRQARRLLPPGGILEFVLTARHESEHFTGSEDEDGAAWASVPDIGNFLMYELAALIPVRDFDLIFRAQLKWFLAYHGRHVYTYAPGLDAIFRWHLTDRVHPFSSFFFEYLVGGTPEGRDERDLYLFRNLTGIILPGRVGDVMFFLSLAVGHGKGNLAIHEELRFGIGARIVWPPLDTRH